MSHSTDTHARDYQAAVHNLNNLQTNAATLEEIKRLGLRAQERSLPEMRSFLRRAGYEPEDLNVLNAVHVTGTKGKGSTCAFVESILQKGGYRTGTFTSPHLVEVRERIRLNGSPISKDDFARYFFECWDRLQGTMPVEGSEDPGMPTYFRFLTLMAFHVFIREKVDVGIIEVGIGGTHDSTNVLVSPFCAGVATIGLDHQALLGNTTIEIAAQKGGIYKRNVPAVAVQQGEAEVEVLRRKAEEAQAPFFLAPEISRYPELLDIRLGLAGKFQASNASLAVALVLYWLEQRKNGVGRSSYRPAPITKGPLDLAQDGLPSFVRDGLESARWPGRAQLIDRGASCPRLYLDGAHTEESLLVAKEWFLEATAALERRKILVFSCTKGRDPAKLLAPLSGVQFSDCILSTPIPFSTNSANPNSRSPDLIDRMSFPEQHLDALQAMADAWRQLNPSASPESIHTAHSVEQAIALADKFGPDCDIFVTGSLYLVGGVHAIFYE